MSNCKRLEYGSFNKMTDEEKKEHLKMLQKRWRKNHPEWVKNQNKKYYKIYKETKPCKCICVRCGREFFAPRSYYKLCGECPSKYELYKMGVKMRRDRKALIAQQAVEMYKTGKYTQEEVAKIFGTYQKQVSNWVKKARKKLTSKK